MLEKRMGEINVRMYKMPFCVHFKWFEYIDMCSYFQPALCVRSTYVALYFHVWDRQQPRGQANKHKGEQNFTIFSSLIMDNCRARLSCRFPPRRNVEVSISPCRSWQTYAARINNLCESSVFIIGQRGSTVVREKSQVRNYLDGLHTFTDFGQRKTGIINREVRGKSIEFSCCIPDLNLDSRYGRIGYNIWFLNRRLI